MNSLNRREAVPALIGNPDDFLIIAGLAGTAKDVAALTNDGDNAFCLAGAMGAAVMMGLGLATARPERQVLVVTGDGELLMNVGALANVAMVNPPNLSILCVDNGHYGETGYQRSHTSGITDLAQMAAGAGFARVETVREAVDFDRARECLHSGNAATFVLLQVSTDPPPVFKRAFSPSAGRTRFRAHLGL